MNDRRIPAILFFVLCVGAVWAFRYNKQHKSAPQPRAAAPVDDWATYEDKILSFKHPPGWKVDFDTKGGNNWFLYRKYEEMNETFLIISRKEPRTLQESYDKYKADQPESIQLTFERPQSIRVRHAECLKYKADAIISAHCRSSEGDYFELQTIWLIRKGQGPTEQSLENAKKFDRILPTIKFK